MNGACRCLLLAAVAAGLGGCAQRQVVENTGAAVTVRYDGMFYTLAAATETADKICGAHGKKAHLRNKKAVAFSERYAHFECL